MCARSLNEAMPTEKRISKLKRVAQARQAGFTVVIEDVFDPHNLGAISRSCDAFGIQQINIIFETQPEFDPKEVGKNSSTATNKWLDYRIHHSTKAALRRLKNEGWQLVAAALDPAAESIFEADLCAPRIALLFGNEKTGLSPEALKLADRRVMIPMRGIAQSMNVSVSAALCIYEGDAPAYGALPAAPQHGAGERCADARLFPRNARASRQSQQKAAGGTGEEAAFQASQFHIVGVETRLARSALLRRQRV